MFAGLCAWEMRSPWYRTRPALFWFTWALIGAVALLIGDVGPLGIRRAVAIDVG